MTHRHTTRGRHWGIDGETIPSKFLFASLLLLILACGSGVTSENEGTTNAAALSTTSKPPTQYTFEIFDVPGATRTVVESLNDLGDAAGTFSDESGRHGFIRSHRGAFTTFDVGVEGALFTRTSGINNRGEVVGWFNVQNGDHQDQHGYRRNRNGQVQVIDFEPFPGLAETYAAAINNRGDIVGGYGPTFDIGYVLHDGKFTSTPNPPNSSSPPLTFPYGINDLGATSGFYISPDGLEHGYILQRGKYTIIDVPDSPSGTEAYNVNDLGQVVVLADVGCGFIFEVRRNRLDPLPCVGIGSNAYAINNRGQFGGLTFDAVDSHLWHGFIATPIDE